MSRWGAFYEAHLLPRIIDVTCSDRMTAKWRAQVCAGVSGDVLEVGFGSGTNLRHYPAAVERVLAVEPSDLAWRRAGKAVADFGRPVERIGLDGAAIDTTLRFLQVTGAVDEAFVKPRLWAGLPRKQRVVRVTEPITAATKEFRFAKPWQGLEVIPKAGTLIATDASKVWRTPYDDCVLVMPSTAHVKPGNTMVRLGRYED